MIFEENLLLVIFDNNLKIIKLSTLSHFPASL